MVKSDEPCCVTSADGKCGRKRKRRRHFPYWKPFSAGRAFSQVFSDAGLAFPLSHLIVVMQIKPLMALPRSSRNRFWHFLGDPARFECLAWRLDAG